MTNKPDAIKAALSVGKCGCDVGMCTHRTNCRLNPLKIAQMEMDKAVVKYLNVYAKEIWNEAIGAAALIADAGDEYTVTHIRKLKKMTCEVSISHWGIFLIDYRYKELTYMRYGLW